MQLPTATTQTYFQCMQKNDCVYGVHETPWIQRFEAAIIVETVHASLHTHALTQTHNITDFSTHTLTTNTPRCTHLDGLGPCTAQ